MAGDLLGGHVPQLALDVHPGALFEQVVGHAEIGELDLALRAHQHVVRRHVAVHDAERITVVERDVVRVLERVEQLAHDVRDHPQPPGLVVDEAKRRLQLEQAHPIDPLHHEVPSPVVLALVEDLHDVDVGQERREIDLGLEHALEARIAQVGIGDHLDGHELVGPALARPSREPHLGHPAHADATDERVASEASTGLEGVGHDELCGEGYQARRGIHAPWRERCRART